MSFVLSVDQAKTIMERAQAEWGADIDSPSTSRVAVIRLFMGGRSQNARERNRRAVGAFHIRWHAPTGDQATIERLEWDPERGGSDEEVRQVIDVLAGWRLAR